jgi:hypothetical protein
MPRTFFRIMSRGSSDSFIKAQCFKVTGVRARGAQCRPWRRLSQLSPHCDLSPSDYHCKNSEFTFTAPYSSFSPLKHNVLTYRAFLKELYNGIPYVTVWRVLWKCLHFVGAFHGILPHVANIDNRCTILLVLVIPVIQSTHFFFLSDSRALKILPAANGLNWSKSSC